MIIAVDVDDVVADLPSIWYALYNREYNDDLAPERVLSWDTHKYVKPECGERIYRYLDEPELYNAVLPVPGALEGVQLLRYYGHRVVFVTSAVPKQMGRKYWWLIAHHFLYGKDSREDYVEATDKSLIRADALVDDGPHNLENFQGTRVLFTRPHNHAAKDYHRVNSWKEVVRLLCGVSPAYWPLSGFPSGLEKGCCKEPYCKEPYSGIRATIESDKE